MKTTFSLFLAAYLLTGCYTEYGGGKRNPVEKGNGGGISGAAIFKKYCQTCHGADGKLGLNGAKNLSVSILPLNQKIEIISNGKGVMTPFRAILSAEEIKAVAEYTEELKK